MAAPAPGAEPTEGRLAGRIPGCKRQPRPHLELKSSAGAGHHRADKSQRAGDATDFIHGPQYRPDQGRVPLEMGDDDLRRVRDAPL